MTYNDLVQHVANEFIDEITEDYSSCESFSEFVDISGMTGAEVKEEFISLADYVIEEFGKDYSDGFIVIDPFTGNIASDEFEEEIPYRMFKKAVVKVVNTALK